MAFQCRSFSSDHGTVDPSPPRKRAFARIHAPSPLVMRSDSPRYKTVERQASFTLLSKGSQLHLAVARRGSKSTMTVHQMGQGVGRPRGSVVSGETYEPNQVVGRGSRSFSGSKVSMTNPAKKIFRACTAFSVSPEDRRSPPSSEQEIRKSGMPHRSRTLAIPKHLSIGLRDRRVVDERKAAPHQAIDIELLVLVSVGT